MAQPESRARACANRRRAVAPTRARRWWHATISLAEGIAVSGQFVRKTNALLGEATQLAKKKLYDRAAALYVRVLAHEDEVEPEVAAAVSLNLAIMRLHAGKLQDARDAATGTVNRFRAILKSPDDGGGKAAAAVKGMQGQLHEVTNQISARLAAARPAS